MRLKRGREGERVTIDGTTIMTFGLEIKGQL